MRPFRYNEMADDRWDHIADVEIGRSLARAVYIRVANLKELFRVML